VLAPQRVLFATDGSDCAERARPHAVRLAAHFRAALHVVHVEERAAELTDVIDVREADVLGDLHSLTGAEGPGGEPRRQERRVVHPSAAEGLLAYAAEHDVSLAVLGTHGRRGLRRLVMGSVAETVVRRAPCPVLTVGRGAGSPAAMEAGEFLVPVDFSDTQDRLLAHVRALARAYDLPVTLLHVVDDASWPAAYGLEADAPSPDTVTDRVRDALLESASGLGRQGIDVQVEVRHGHPAATILTAVGERDANLLALGTHGRSGVERVMLGSVAETVIRRAPCPVFTVRSFGRSMGRGSEGAG
jgi:nucleotide-binding universal stress UspA family protein